MKRFLLASALAMAVSAPVHAQVVFDNTAGANGASPRGLGTAFDNTDGIGQAFVFSSNVRLTQFGFLLSSTTGGVFKFFIQDAANNTLISDTRTLAATSSPAVALSDVFSLAVSSGSTLSLGLIAQSPNTQYLAAFIFPPNLTPQNGITPVSGNENFTNFDNPTQTGDGGVTFAMQLRGNAVVTATPEPAPLALMGTGLAGILIAVRRRRTQQG